MNTREAAVGAAQESLAVRNGGGGGSSWDAKEMEGMEEMGGKGKVGRRRGEAGGYLCLGKAARGCACGALPDRGDAKPGGANTHNQIT